MVGEEEAKFKLQTWAPQMMLLSLYYLLNPIVMIEKRSSSKEFCQIISIWQVRKIE